MDEETGFVSGPVEFISDSNLFSEMQETGICWIGNNRCRIDWI